MFYAGFSRVDVTPPLGSPLAGSYKARYAKGVHDPIQLNALAVNDGENTIVIIAGDFLCIGNERATMIRNMIAEAVNLPLDNVIITTLHQHASLTMGRPMTISEMKDEAYLDILYRKYCDVAKMAIDDMKEATVCIAQKETAEQISFIRRFKMKDGSASTNPGRLNPDIVHPIGEPDNTVRIIRFKRENAKDIAFVNFSTHPAVVSAEMISADWPGFVRRFTEAELDNVHCIFVTGAQGDSNHHDVTKEKYTCTNYQYSEHMGRVITDTVKEIWDTAKPCNAFKLKSKVETLSTLTKTDGLEKLEWAKKIQEDYKKSNVKTSGGLLNLLGESGRILKLSNQTLYQKLIVTVVGMGDIAFVGYGCEPFTQYATEARSYAPDMFVINFCCTNGYAGYIPTEESFAEGGYEANTSNFTPDIATKIKTSVKTMLDDYKEYKNS